jgi:hypothetical protein
MLSTVNILPSTLDGDSMNKNGSFILREIEGIHLLIAATRNDVTDDFIYINDMGVFVWNNTERCPNIESLVALTCKEYQITIAEDIDAVAAFCTNLLDSGLIEE